MSKGYFNLDKSPEFIEFQNRFYHSKQWIELAKYVRLKSMNKCNRCGLFIKKRKDPKMSGRHQVDHIIEITEENMNDESITLNIDNLQLLCLECHTIKTAEDRREAYFGDIDIESERNINLF